MELDEAVFSTLGAINENWTTHAAKSEDTVTEKGGAMDEMKDEIALQKEQIRILREIVEKLQESQSAVEAASSDSEGISEYEGNTNAFSQQVDEITMPSEAGQSMQEPQAAAAATTPNSESVSKCEGEQKNDRRTLSMGIQSPVNQGRRYKSHKQERYTRL